MINKYLYKNLPKTQQKQINDLKEFTTDLEQIYKVDPNINFLVYKEHEQIVAYLAYKNLEDSYDIYNIVVHKDYQRQGIAQKLLNQIMDKNIILEVKANNEKALNFYKKNSFKIQGIKKRYYKDKQDAIIMMR